MHMIFDVDVYISYHIKFKYAVATLEGAGMRNDDICLSFELIIRRHIEKYTGREPLSFSEFSTIV